MSWVPSPAATTDTEAEGINEYLQHVEFKLNVVHDEVEYFNCGEELEHELDCPDVAAGNFEQEEERAEEGEVDELVRVETSEDATDKTTLAFATCLKKLANLQVLKTCKVGNCSSGIDLDIKQVGTAMYFKWTCTEKGHINKRWCSQPRFKFGQHVGDFKLACAILFTGGNYSKVATLLQAIDMKPVAQTAYTRIHSHYAVLSITKHWENLSNSILEKFHQQDLVVLGDGRMDSPGFNAQFCTYTIMENETKDIVALEVVDKREVKGKSNSSAAAERECSILLPWVSHITNHFWHLVKHCNTYEEFMAKWRGVLHHVSGTHQWLCTDGYGTGQCDHGPLEEKEDDEKELIPSGSKAHLKLRGLLFDTNLLGKIEMYLNFRTTSELESFNNKILGYVSKKHSFQFPGYQARCLLAAMDYQENKVKESVKNQSGEYRLYRKCSAHWDVVYVKEKSFDYIGELMKRALAERFKNPQKYQQPIPMSAYDPRKLASHSGKVPPPPTKELYEAKKTRFEFLDENTLRTSILLRYNGFGL